MGRHTAKMLGYLLVTGFYMSKSSEKAVTCIPAHSFKKIWNFSFSKILYSFSAIFKRMLTSAILKKEFFSSLFSWHTKFYKLSRIWFVEPNSYLQWYNFSNVSNNLIKPCIFRKRIKFCMSWKWWGVNDAPYTKPCGDIIF